ncbi:hypothetical protein GCM10010275_32970 [Streptomyces litmocidini]|uniref:SMI1/KNR4 family protein n=1 Tax=Streptomyces litmocidini TaxID=67318 RepID=UPI00167DE1A8|nr:SMI1/KNR4 family protein [Streptomyces litmocidini]GGU93111.1 hypothetical protein GCM10010275_32970 [Streptomyces litmocidini]
MTRFGGVRAAFRGEDPHGDPPLTDAAVRDAERRPGVRLPSSLLALLRDREGGVVADARDAYPTDAPTSWSDDYVPFDLLMGIGEEHGDRPSLLDSPYLVEEWGLPSPRPCSPAGPRGGSRSTTGRAERTGSRPSRGPTRGARPNCRRPGTSGRSSRA